MIFSLPGSDERVSNSTTEHIYGTGKNERSRSNTDDDNTDDDPKWRIEQHNEDEEDEKTEKNGKHMFACLWSLINSI